jgi:serpin B
MKPYRQIKAVLGFIAIACSDPAAPPVQPITALPRELTAAENKIIAASNDFAFDLFRTGNRAQRNSNVFISPLSASMALGMTANGAAGATYDEMRAGLRLGSASREEVNDGYKSLITLLTGLDRTTTFQIANSIWYKQNFPFHASFLDESRTYFDAKVEALDFTSPAALTTINGWVSDQTNDRIPQILNEIRRDEVMFLINAIYFKGTWQKQFDKARTQPAQFRAADGTSESVPMMWREAGVDHVQTTEYSAVDLPYGNTAFTMTVVIPNTMDIDTFAESFDQSKWNALVDGLKTNGSLEVYLPKFRLEWERLLNDDLEELGMRLPFSAGAADFTRMSPAGRDLFITRVLQKTFVEVDEAGTEAAAATVVGIGETSLPPSFRADRPFLVVIRERFSGTILFIGKVAKLPA